MTRSDDRIADVLDVLACPRCGDDLALDDALSCPRGHLFPIVRGIPRFTEPTTYADSFGFQWGTFRTTQLDDADHDASANAFTVKTGLTRSDVEGKDVLDVGCGMGRYADVVSRWGARRVVAMDLSSAVEAASENLARHPRTTVIQADALSPPIRSGSFDLVFSIGVLHHTSSTARAFARAAATVKPGGQLAVWVYSKHLRRLQPGSEVIRLVTRRLPEERLLGVIRSVQPKVDAVRQRWPRADVILSRVMPTSYHPDPEWRVLDTFDWYSPWYQHKHSVDEVSAWFRQAGFRDLWIGPEPVSVRGQRTSSPPPA